MTWFKNRKDEYIFVSQHLSIFNKLWLWLKGFREECKVTEEMKGFEREFDDIYTIIKKETKKKS